MTEENTELFFKDMAVDQAALQADSASPRLFVCQGHMISEYKLSGRQSVGRPAENSLPDIPLTDRTVSRLHGYFNTERGKTVYTASDTVNGVFYRGKVMKPGTELLLCDGDELMIPSGDEMNPIIIVYTCTAARAELWRGLQRASKDALTTLYGRDSFEFWWHKNRQSSDYAEAVLFIVDVDDFKEINDQTGHNQGDDVLRIVAQELKNAVRYETQVCRWGGDEFVGIIPGSSEQAAKRLFVVKKRISEKSREAGIPATVSIGYTDVHITNDTADLKGIVEIADQALYRSKQKGKDSMTYINSI